MQIQAIKRNEDDTLDITLNCSSWDVKKLNGEFDNILLIDANKFPLKSSISSRGMKDVTKYFLIPREVRDKLGSKVTAKVEEDTDNYYFIYKVEKQ